MYCRIQTFVQGNVLYPTKQFKANQSKAKSCLKNLHRANAKVQIDIYKHISTFQLFSSTICWQNTIKINISVI